MRVHLLALSLLLGCEPMAKHSVNGLSGLWTNPNENEAPRGALAVAQGVVRTRSGELEPRRGMEKRGSVSGALNAISYFGGYLVAHHGASTLSRSSDSGATWTAYSGTYSPPDSTTPVDFYQLGGSLFFNTSAGLYELDSATGTPRLAGVPRALDPSAALVASNSAGWMTADGRWAYRAVWGYKNANGKVELSAPSGRVLVTSPAAKTVAAAGLSKPNASSTVTATVTSTSDLTTGDYVTITLGGTETYFTAGTFQITVASGTTFTYSDAQTNGSGSTQTSTNAATAGVSGVGSLSVPIPSGITTIYFLQVYRSAKSANASSEPADDMGLVYEAVPTNVQISAGTMTVTDLAPDSMRGETLYTSIQGVLAAKDRPPMAKQVAQWRGVALYGDVQGVERFTFRFLGLSSWVNGFPTLRVYEGSSNVLSLIGDSTESATTFKIYTSGTVAQNIADTARSFVRVFNAKAKAGGRTYRAVYLSGETDAPGTVLIERTGANDSAFTMIWFDVPAGRFAPNVSTVLTSPSTSRAGTTVTVNTNVAHGLTTGQQVSLFSPTPDANFPAGNKTITVVDADTFTYTEAGSAVAAAVELYFWTTPDVDSFADATPSDSEDFPNRLMWSEPNEGGAVPLVNFTSVGDESTTILRIVPTRDKAVIVTDKGLYQLLGNYPSFAVTELDTTVKGNARGTAVPFLGQAVALTSSGFVQALDSVVVKSASIDNVLRDLQAAYSSYVSQRAFAVPYESERMLLLFLPSGANAYASNAYAFHADAADGAPWTEPFVSFNATCGFVSPGDDRLYLGDSSGQVWRERKARSTLDAGDVRTGLLYTASDGAGLITSTETVAVGDVVLDDATGVYGRVTVVDEGVAFNIEAVTGALDDWTSGTFQRFSPISVVIEPVGQYPAGTSGEAVVDTGVLDFASAEFTTINEAVGTNLSTLSAAVTLTNPVGSTSSPLSLPFPAPLNSQRGTRYRLRLTHATALERFVLKGFTLNYRNTAARGR